MSAEPDDRDEPWTVCPACDAEDSLIEGWDEQGREVVVCGECGAILARSGE